jgi:hypothetical protein
MGGLRRSGWRAAAAVALSLREGSSRSASVPGTFPAKGRARFGRSAPACAGIFGDVTCPSTLANSIEQLAAESITGGCGGGNDCPNNPNTRGQMAVFPVKTFGLVLYGP